MTLTNIEYGSIASSDILNKNFTNLDEKIVSSKKALDADISSAMSNIASINLKLNDLSDALADLNSTLLAQINEMKNKVQFLLNEIAMPPNWIGVFNVDKLEELAVEYNGYLYLVPEEEKAQIEVNGITFEIVCSTFLPLKAGDNVKSSSAWQNIKFLPVSGVVLESL